MASPERLRVVLQAIAWLIASLTVTLLHGLGLDDSQTLIFFGSAIFIQGSLKYLASGGTRVSALGLFNLSSGVFLGLSCIALSEEVQRYPGVVQAAAAVAVGLALVNLTAGLMPATAEPRVITVPLEQANLFMLLGSGSLFILYLAKITGAQASLSLDGASFSAALAISIGIVLHPASCPLLIRALLALTPLAAYEGLFYDGTGRLRLAAYIAIVAVLVTARDGRRWLKPASVAGIPLILWWSGRDRLALEASLGGEPTPEQSGLESMYATILVFGELISAQDDGFPLAWGASFFATPFALLPDEHVPRWAPQPLGYDLVMINAPELYGSGFSTVASVFGEFWWNFGFVGLIFGSILMGVLLGEMDAWLVRASRFHSKSRSGVSLIVVIIIIVLVGGLPDLVWGTFHTWLGRFLSRVPLLIFVLLIAYSLRRQRHGRLPQH